MHTWISEVSDVLKKVIMMYCAKLFYISKAMGAIFILPTLEMQNTNKLN